MQARQYYYGEVAFVDQQFGRLLDWMKSRHMLENTIIVFLSDHGTHLGDYGLVQKGSFFEPVAKVPYFYWYPQGIAGGQVLHTAVETRSLMPTLLALAGLAAPADLTINNLAENLISGQEPGGKPVFSEIGMGINDTRYMMVREGHYKLSLIADPELGQGYLTNLVDDPYERVNLYDNPDYTEVKDRLLKHTSSHLQDTLKPYPNVKSCPPKYFDVKEIACPTCRRTARTREIDLAAGIAWTQNLLKAYQCNHCGTRFGLKQIHIS